MHKKSSGSTYPTGGSNTPTPGGKHPVDCGESDPKGLVERQRGSGEGTPVLSSTPGVNDSSPVAAVADTAVHESEYEQVASKSRRKSKKIRGDSGGSKSRKSRVQTTESPGSTSVPVLPSVPIVIEEQPPPVPMPVQASPSAVNTLTDAVGTGTAGVGTGSPLIKSRSDSIIASSGTGDESGLMTELACLTSPSLSFRIPHANSRALLTTRSHGDVSALVLEEDSVVVCGDVTEVGYNYESPDVTVEDVTGTGTMRDIGSDSTNAMLSLGTGIVSAHGDGIEDNDGALDLDAFIDNDVLPPIPPTPSPPLKNRKHRKYSITVDSNSDPDDTDTRCSVGARTPLSKDTSPAALSGATMGQRRFGVGLDLDLDIGEEIPGEGDVSDHLSVSEVDEKTKRKRMKKEKKQLKKHKKKSKKARKKDKKDRKKDKSEGDRDRHKYDKKSRKGRESELETGTCEYESSLPVDANTTSIYSAVCTTDAANIDVAGQGDIEVTQVSASPVLSNKKFNVTTHKQSIATGASVVLPRLGKLGVFIPLPLDLPVPRRD